MGEVTRGSVVIMLGALVGFALGAVMLGYAALAIGFLCLSHVPGGIHSDWSIVVLFAVPICFCLGGVAGGGAAVSLIRVWLGQKA